MRLHARMVVMLPKFNYIAMACHKKFKVIFYAYKEDKMANGISRNIRQESKFYDLGESGMWKSILDSQWLQRISRSFPLTPRKDYLSLRGTKWVWVGLYSLKF